VATCKLTVLKPDLLRGGGSWYIEAIFKYPLGHYVSGILSWYIAISETLKDN